MRMRPKMLLAGFASAGALETGYLSVSKLLQNNQLVERFCGATSNCLDVLNGPYATIPGLNIPLVSVGFAGYLTIATLSFLPEKSKSIDPQKPENEDNINDSLILFTSTSMATFSAYLMFILAFILHQKCDYCILSAILSASMLITAWKGRIVPNKTKATVLTSTSALITAVASIFLFSTTNRDIALASTAPAAQYLEQQQPKAPPTVTRVSSKKAISLAQRLKSLDAKMFGAYWCSHCFNQKQEFGKEAFALIPYIECDKQGVDTQYSLCREKKVRKSCISS